MNDFTDIQVNVTVDTSGPEGFPVRVAEMGEGGEEGEVHYFTCAEALDFANDLQRAVNAFKDE